MRRYIFASVVTIIAAPVAAQTDQQIEVVMGITQAMMLSDKCGRSHVDTAVLGDTMDRYGLTKEDIQEGGDFAAVVAMTAISAKNDMADHAPATACTVARKFFGPAGTSIRGLVVDE